MIRIDYDHLLNGLDAPEETDGRQAEDDFYLSSSNVEIHEGDTFRVIFGMVADGWSVSAYNSLNQVVGLHYTDS